MPLVDPEALLHKLILSESSRSHLDRSEAKRARLRFEDFLAKFGIDDLGELSPAQALTLVAARNLAPAVDLLQIPQGKPPQEEDAHRAYDAFRQKTSLGPGINEYLDQVPDESSDLAILRDPEDIPNAVPEDLLLRRRAPKEFLRRMTEGELLRNAWIHQEQESLLEVELEAPESILDPKGAGADDESGIFGYLLLDGSESMGADRDGRSVCARGLALAFLLSQFEGGNPTVVRIFRSYLSPPFGGEGEANFQRAVSAVLQHGHQGMTNLQDTLAELATNMTQRGSRADVVLITDGITRLGSNPLGTAHLHTFLIGERPEEMDKFNKDQYLQSVRTLESWSDFFFRVELPSLSDAVAPRREDLLSLKRALINVEVEIAEAVTAAKIRRVLQRITNVAELFRAYVDRHGEHDPSIHDLGERLAYLRATTQSLDPADTARMNAQELSAMDQTKAASLEIRELRSLLDQQNPEFTATRGGTELVDVSVWNALASLLKRYLARWLKRVRA
jgi:hypothetical protein